MLKKLTIALLSFLVTLVALILGISYVSDPVLTKRLLTMSQGPEQLVPGGPLVQLPVATPEQRTISAAALDAALVYGAETDSHALLVYRNGRIELEHYYSGHDADSITPTQSMHKSVLAMLIGIAIDEGHIPSENAAAATWLTEWQDDDRARITIRQMLQQTSGIDFDSFSPNIRSGFFQLMMGADIRPVALNNGVLFPPDTEFDYNSVNPQALGILLERATGTRYADYLSQVLWRHLGVPAASVFLDSSEHLMARTFCCLQATARAWLHLGVLHLEDGRFGGRQLVPAEWMQAIRTPGEIQPNYGYLTWLGTEWQEYRYYNRKTSTSVYHSEAYKADTIAYFDGMGGQRVYIIPAEDLVIVRTGAITMDWDDAMLPNLILNGLQR